MRKQLLSVTIAAMCVAVFGLMYPEYILLPDTYDYIAEESSPYKKEMFVMEQAGENVTDLLYAKPEQIRVSSKILQMLEEEGIIIWKNRD